MRDAKSLAEIDASLTTELRKRQPGMLALTNKKTVPALHGVIGSKNNTYVDAVREQFLSPQEFITEWEAGALEAAETRDASDEERWGRAYKSTAAHKIIRLLKDPAARDYIGLFLTRNFYRQYHERVRAKPADALWEIWFGGNPLLWGLLIAPRFKAGLDWHNDVSEIRRAKFQYWTIGHALSTGLVVAERTEPHTFGDLDDFFNFYQNVIIRDTKSTYSKEVGKRYESFVRKQEKPELIPFLIPEFRFGGSATEHKFRLDFAVLSAERREKVGFELNPWSTHGRVAGVKALQAAGGKVAVQLAERAKWEKDWDKRNAYFKSFGITALTYTDKDLRDIDRLFSQMARYLTPAPEFKVRAVDHQRRLDGYSI